MSLEFTEIIGISSISSIPENISSIDSLSNWAFLYSSSSLLLSVFFSSFSSFTGSIFSSSLWVGSSSFISLSTDVVLLKVGFSDLIALISSMSDEDSLKLVLIEDISNSPIL